MEWLCFVLHLSGLGLLQVSVILLGKLAGMCLPMAMAEVPSTFQASVFITFVNILLAKANHTAPPGVQGKEVRGDESKC